MRVRVVEGACQGPQESHHLLEIHLAAELVGQRPSADELEDEVGDAAFLSKVVDVEDVRMLEPGDRPRFLLEALAILLVLGKEIGQNLDRHVAVEPRVVSLVNRRHASAPDLFDDPVGAEDGAGFEAHWSSFAGRTRTASPRVSPRRATPRYGAA